MQFLVNPPGSMVPSEYRNADAIFWQSPLATETSFGEIAELGYFVKWEGDVPMLCRFFINPSIKSNSKMVRNPKFLIYDAEPTAWLSPALLSDAVQPGDASLSYRGLFAEYVLGLWVQCEGLDGRVLPRDFDSRSGYMNLTSDGVSTVKRYLPASVKISIAQTDARHADALSKVAEKVRLFSQDQQLLSASDFLKRLQSEAENDTAVAKLLPSIRVYSTRVRLKNAR